MGATSIVYFSDLDPSIIDKALGTQIDYRSSVGALSFLLWDICITFDDEVRSFGPHKINQTSRYSTHSAG
ncbi:hypothetical protein B0H10DRAFT_2101813 [Mycena sp. CBHHK59/15]|nr:hypothetical protein B0H10DRAFT_2101813 [Mycena sp. CBHHK59/15]